jgi:hypothetical protein
MFFSKASSFFDSGAFYINLNGINRFNSANLFFFSD